MVIASQGPSLHHVTDGGMSWHRFHCFGLEPDFRITNQKLLLWMGLFRYGQWRYISLTKLVTVGTAIMGWIVGRYLFKAGRAYP